MSGHKLSKIQSFQMIETGVGIVRRYLLYLNYRIFVGDHFFLNCPKVRLWPIIAGRFFFIGLTLPEEGIYSRHATGKKKI